MPQRLHFIRFLSISLALHVVVLTAVFFLSRAAEERTPPPMPVRIVNLPPEAVKRLPFIERPAPVPQRSIPAPRKFGTGEEGKLPETTPPAGEAPPAGGGEGGEGKDGG